MMLQGKYKAKYSASHTNISISFIVLFLWLGVADFLNFRHRVREQSCEAGRAQHGFLFLQSLSAIFAITPLAGVIRILPLW
jgi:hypothetical protein